MYSAKYLIASLLAASAVAAVASEAQSARCSFDSKLIVKNNTGVTITTVAVIHRSGKPGDRADIAVWSNLPDGATTAKPAIVHAEATTHKLNFGTIQDWWTVIFSYKELSGDQDVDKVFAMRTHTGQRLLDNIRSSLVDGFKAVATAELKTIITAPALVPIVEPAIKILAAALGSKSASLDGYTEARLRCEDVNKTTIVTIGNKGNPSNKNTITIAVPQEREHETHPYVVTMQKPEAIVATVEKRLKQEEKKEEAPASGQPPKGTTKGNN